MPSEAKKHCPRGHKSYIGRRCPECERKRNIERGTAHERGYDKEWKEFRLKYLQAFPNCSIEDCLDPATDVDHIKSLKEGGEKFDMFNLRSFCHRHHSQRTGRDNVKHGRK